MSPAYVGLLGATFVLLCAVLLRTFHAVLFGALAKERLAGSERIGTLLRVGIRRRPDALPGQLPTLPLCLVTAATATYVLARVGIVPALIAFIGGVLVTRAGNSFLRQRALHAYEKQLPLALDAISRSLRSGTGLFIAIEEVATTFDGALGHDLQRVAREAQFGAGLTHALDQWADRRNIPSVTLCASAMALTIETGAPQAQAVDAVAESLRLTIELRAKAQTAATESKVSAYVLCSLPVFLGVPAVATNPNAQHFLFQTFYGSAVLLAGFALMGTGAFVMTMMIKRATS